MWGSFISVVQRQGWLVITDAESITVPLMITFSLPFGVSFHKYNTNITVIKISHYY